jgi:triacylglycerol lipase
VLARVQQLIALLLLVAVLAAVAAVARVALPLYFAALPALIVASYLAVLAAEFWMLWRAYSAADPCRPSLARLARAWATEATAAPRVFLWRQPFRSRAEADHLPVSAKGRRGVLLVHGFFCNRGLWNPWMRRLRLADAPYVAINLEPLFGSIDSYRSTIDKAVADLERVTSLAPVIVCHSMGGLAVRAWLAAESREERVHRVVTIASPHAGTRMAGRGVGANIRQMRPGSAWLDALAASTSPSMRERFVCFWSTCDNIVFPTQNATLAGASNRHLAATPHVQMAYHPTVLEEVFELIGTNVAPRTSTS